MNRFQKTATALALLALPTLAIAHNFPNLPGRSFAGTFTIGSFLSRDLPGGDFNAELGKAYQERAAYEASRAGDANWYDATAFAAKGKAALAGEEVQPWEPGALGLSQARYRVAYNATRARVAAFRNVNPKACAQTLALFDHWLEQAREGNHSITPADAVLKAWAANYKACRGAVAIYGYPVNDAQPTDDDRRIRDEPEPNRGERSKAIALAEGLGADERSGLLELIDAVLIVEGNTSTTAGEAYNQRLSERRAAWIRDLLVANGVSPDRIRPQGRGEKNLEVPTEDGVEEYRNRRSVVSGG